jgi:acetyltransferase-like isoleucine patch superfamily enzyme
MLSFARSLLDPRVYAHVARLLHYWNYSHVAPRRAAAIGRGVLLAPTITMRNGERISIGAGSRLGSNCSLWAGDTVGRIDIGENALFGPDVYVTASNYRTDPGAPILHQPKEERSVRIGRDVWLGARVIVVAGVTIGDGCVVGAGSVVTRSLPPQTICAGTPARVLRERGEQAPVAALVAEDAA